MDLISIIVPVYKVEKYLDKCVQSIVDQTYQNLEIILVDDGSPDNCGAMCDVWAEKDSRIKVIHKANGGLSDARNAGMAVTTGDWVTFVDSDDWLDPDMYEALLNTAREADADVVACRYQMVYPGQESFPKVCTGDITILKTQDAMESLIQNGLVKQVVWNKLYSAHLVKNIPFALGKWHEDEIWTWQVIMKANRYAAVDKLGYYYLQRNGSIMGQSYCAKRLDALEGKCQRHAAICENMPELTEISLCSLWYDMLYQAQCAKRTLKGGELTKVFAVLKETQRTHPLPERKPATLNKKYWLWFQMAEKSLMWTCTIRNWLKIGM